MCSIPQGPETLEWVLELNSVIPYFRVAAKDIEEGIEWSVVIFDRPLFVYNQERKYIIIGKGKTFVVYGIKLLTL